MHEIFPGYYKPTDKQFEQLWRECTFAFDTNVLLDLYSYTPEALSRVFEILEGFKDRIWLPHQVALEYERNRVSTINDQLKPYTELQKSFNTLVTTVKTKTGQRHRLLGNSSLLQITESAMEEAQREIDRLKGEHPDLGKSDTIADRIATLFDGRVGKPYTGTDRENALRKAQYRFELEIPPGFRDKGKGDYTQYGDAIIWLQLLDYTRHQRKPMIFVTGDEKDDWWNKNGSEKTGPKPELIQEMLDEAGTRFYLYSPERFNEYATQVLGLEQKPDVIEEIREVTEQERAEAGLEAEQISGGYPRLRDLDWLERAIGTQKQIDQLLEVTGGRGGALNQMLEATRVADRLLENQRILDRYLPLRSSRDNE